MTTLLTITLAILVIITVFTKMRKQIYLTIVVLSLIRIILFYCLNWKENNDSFYNIFIYSFYNTALYISPLILLITICNLIINRGIEQKEKHEKFLKTLPPFDICISGTNIKMYNKKIVKVIGLVQANSDNFATEGGLGRAQEEVKINLIRKAQALGANAIIDYKTSSSTYSSLIGGIYRNVNTAQLMASGNAVILEDQD